MNRTPLGSRWHVWLGRLANWNYICEYYERNPLVIRLHFKKIKDKLLK